MDYDSTADTLAHIKQVNSLMLEMAISLQVRAMEHDRSKLENPEKAMFDEYTPKLRGMTYGSDEYKQCLQDMGVALAHHYKENSHHPEHYGTLGVNGMSLLDVLEMLCDWKAATLRHADGDIRKSLEINKARFGLSDQLLDILKNTVNDFHW